MDIVKSARNKRGIFRRTTKKISSIILSNCRHV
jgi:hypothetical protein